MNARLSEILAAATSEAEFELGVPIALGAFGGTGVFARFVLGPTLPALVATVVGGGALHFALLWRRRTALDLALRDRRSLPIRTG